jgi:membrane protein YdbS with pleckstrin-like domain
MNEEKNIWRGSSSPIVYLGFFLVCGVSSLLLLALAVMAAFKWGALAALVCAALLLIPVLAGVVKLISNQSRVYEITTQRIRVTTGVFSKTSQETELYRVVDMTLQQPFLYRLCKRGSLVLATNDTTTPILALEALPNVESLREELRRSVEACREQKRVRLMEME